MKLELASVSLQYNGRPPLFRDVDLVLESGEMILLKGPSGSGKSSFLRLLNRLQEPTSGQLLVDDRPADEHEITALRRRIGYVQQTPVMIDGTVRDNLLLPYRFKASRGESPPPREQLRQLLDGYNLREVGLDDDASPLSVGQKQRVALIRSLSVAPELLLCDEPTSALDPDSRAIVEGELERCYRQRGMGVVLVTHIDSELASMRSRTLLLDGGTLREDGA